MADPFDPQRLALPPAAAKQTASTEPPRHKARERFLKGPVPWTWLAIASQQPGKALHAALALWFLAGVKRDRTVVLSGALLGELGVSRHSGYRGLLALERTGLISVKRHPGRNPTVTIQTVDNNQMGGKEEVSAGI